MEIHWVTFRLAEKTVGGRDYNTRYKALGEAVGRHCEAFWDEPTSFWLVKSASTRSQIAATVKGAIAPTEDTVLIGTMGQAGALLVGTSAKLQTLKALIPALAGA